MNATNLTTTGLKIACEAIAMDPSKAVMTALIEVFGTGFDLNEPCALVHGIGPVSHQGRRFHETADHAGRVRVLREAIVISQVRDAKRMVVV